MHNRITRRLTAKALARSAWMALAAVMFAGCATPERPASGTVYVITTVELKPGHRDDFVALYKIYAPQILAQPGCLEYALDTERFIDQQGLAENFVAILEKWENLDAVRAHRDSALLAEFEEKGADAVEDISRLIMKQQ